MDPKIRATPSAKSEGHEARKDLLFGSKNTNSRRLELNPVVHPTSPWMRSPRPCTTADLDAEDDTCSVSIRLISRLVASLPA